MLRCVAKFAVRFALIVTKDLNYFKMYKGGVVAFLCCFLLEATVSSRKKKVIWMTHSQYQISKNETTTAILGIEFDIQNWFTGSVLEDHKQERNSKKQWRKMQEAASIPGLGGSMGRVWFIKT